MITRSEFEKRFRSRINDELIQTLDDDFPNKQDALSCEIYEELLNDGVEISLEDEDRLFLWVCDYSESETENTLNSWKEIFGTTASTIDWKDEIKKRTKEKEYETEGLAIKCFSNFDTGQVYPHHAIFIRVDNDSCMLICNTNNRFNDIKISKRKTTKSDLEKMFGIKIFEMYPAKIKFEKR